MEGKKQRWFRDDAFFNNNNEDQERIESTFLNREEWECLK